MNVSSNAFQMWLQSFIQTMTEFIFPLYRRTLFTGRHIVLHQRANEKLLQENECREKNLMNINGKKNKSIPTDTFYNLSALARAIQVRRWRNKLIFSETGVTIMIVTFLKPIQNF